MCFKFETHIKTPPTGIHCCVFEKRKRKTVCATNLNSIEVNKLAIFIYTRIQRLFALSKITEYQIEAMWFFESTLNIFKKKTGQDLTKSIRPSSPTEPPRSWPRRRGGAIFKSFLTVQKNHATRLAARLEFTHEAF